MTDADKILAMIESVDPADTETLDEIDARVFCFTHKKNYEAFKFEGAIGHGLKFSLHPDFVMAAPQYTRSRDALKHIRPEGWVYIREIDNCDGWPYIRTAMQKRVNEDGELEDEVLNHIGTLATEELAELHAIIQAIKHERMK